MSILAPTGNTYDEDLKEWMFNIIPAIQRESRQIVLMLADDEVVGYFQYNIRRDCFVMEEIQISKDHQGTGLFDFFYAWLIPKLPKDLKYVEAYSNKRNYKSQGILEHLGLIRLGENENGKSFYYKGDYSILFRKYSEPGT